MSQEAARIVLDDEVLAELHEISSLGSDEVLDDLATARAREVLRDVEVLVTGWGCPELSAEVLAAAPRLRAVVHTAGSVRGHITSECWDRGIAVSSAAAANAVPVAEYTLAMILLTGKDVLGRTPGEGPAAIGNFGRTVGILSASLIGRRVIELLRPHDFDVLLSDPYVTAAEAEALGARSVELDELFARSDVVSVHTPLLPTTRGLVGRALIESMRPAAVLINTARGAILDQDALLDAASAGRVRAVLDVTEPEVLAVDHPLRHCPNVLITPHLAGSRGNECRRLARHAVAELRRWAAGSGFAHPVHREQLERIA
ncbi:hydroxyacid dehydrogenase [Saccharopolyspora gloriosae]|uniref:hydroxyacid dehydrogenase n=1 Tax=Saccharopolyspora gloriosae TaxID=455344 RepID=UPI001FB5BF8A|nr:hydroxyacid dehydrogenase [Saccharopolyspora gloriosae]